MRDPLEWVEDVLGYRFSDTAILTEALTHRSAGGPNNERLEFLGDAILNFVIADLLLHEHPDSSEGDLSRLRATLVKGPTLANLAAEIDVGQYLELGAGERKSGGSRRESILADALEALFGAIYVDGGYGPARRSIVDLFTTPLQSLPAASELKDPKTQLQELLQARGMPVPSYSVEDVAGAAHEQTFRVRCVVASLSIEEFGEGGSRRRAEQQAARKVLERLVDGEG